MRRTLTFEKTPTTFDLVLDRLATDEEATAFMDRGFAIFSGNFDVVIKNLSTRCEQRVVNVLARDDDGYDNIQWRYLDDMPDLEMFLNNALLECEEEEI